MRIVVDTNVWVSGLLWKGLPTEILRLAETRHIEICSTTAIVTELERVLEYGRIQKQLDKLQLTRSDVVGFALTLMVIVEPIVLTSNIFVDPDDDMFIACVLAARADYYYNETSPGSGGSARLCSSETPFVVRRGEAAPHHKGNVRGGRRPPHPRRAEVSLEYYIVSGDQHLLTLGQWQGIQIVTVNDFLSRHFPRKTNE